MNKRKTSFDLLYLFKDIMRFGSFQKAAKDIGCTTASIEKKIAQMEVDLGITVFEHGSGGMVPTSAGLFLYDELDSVFWNMDAILQRARSIPPEGSMTLNLGIYDMISESFYRRLIQKFVHNHPDIKLCLSAPYLPEMRRKLVEGSMDVALTYSIGLTDEPGLIRIPLSRGKPCIYYCDTQLHVSDGEEITIDAFRNCTFVCLNTDIAARNMLRDLPFEPQKVIFAESLKSLYLYVNAGMACTVLGPSQALHETPGISYFELSDVEYTMGIDLVWEEFNTNPAILLLVDCAKRVFQPVTGEDR